MEHKKLIGRRIRLYTKKDFTFCGEVLDEDDTHFWIYDEHKQREMLLEKSWCSEIVILDNEVVD